MSDQRRANRNWNIAEEDGNVPTWERVGIAVMMDIRDEMQKLNQLLSCPNFTGIPRTLIAIRRNTTKAKRRKAAR